MRTECNAEQFEFEGFGRRRVVAAFDGGALSSDGGGLLLRHTDRALGLIERVAACFQDNREQDQVVHTLPALVGQRIVGIARGYEDVNDHDGLRHDPVFALLADRLEPQRPDCAPLAGKSTLNRLEHAPLRPDDRYHKIGHDPAAPATRAWSPNSKLTWPSRRPSMPRAANRRGASRSSATPPWTAGAVCGA